MACCGIVRALSPECSGQIGVSRQEQPSEYINYAVHTIGGLTGSDVGISTLTERAQLLDEKMMTSESRPKFIWWSGGPLRFPSCVAMCSLRPDVLMLLWIAQLSRR